MGKISNSTAMQAQGNERKTLQAYIKSMEGEIAKALPSVITPERFTRITLTALRMTPQLSECTPQSFLGAMMQAAQTGLEPNTPLGLSWILPRRNHKKGGIWEAQFQIGYQGLKTLAYRSGDIALVDARVVYENDDFECEFGLNPKLKLIPANGDRGLPIKVYALYKTKSGSFGFEVSSIEDIKKFAEIKSDAYKNRVGPWKTDFLEMAKKTVLKKALKLAPMSTEFQTAMSSDETVKVKIDKDMYSVRDEDSIVIDTDAVEIPDDADAPQADAETGEVLDPMDAVEEY